ncbi:MAG: hypothetical protein HYR91_04145 [Flavobacteriia bacterium]|nr:hypothetical protein [Flavobacteriia bacterium]
METKTKYLLWSLGAIAVGTGGYFLFKHIQSKKEDSAVEDFVDQIDSDFQPSSDQNSLPASSSKPSGYKPAPQNSTFPLKRKSKGTLVKDVQLALIKKYGGSILPKYGADGFYGQEMETALKSKGLPTTIDSKEYGKIVTSDSKNGNDKPKSETKNTDQNNYKALAKTLHDSVIEDNIFTALSILKKIKNKEQYIYLNEEFKKIEFALVSNTVVNALLSRFTSMEYKKKINAEFYRIGLKYDGSKWSLSGVYGLEDRLMTTVSTKVWDRVGKSLIVPQFTILGTYSTDSNGITEFETVDGRFLFVNTKSIKHVS